MKKISSIIAVILLFIISSLIIWDGLYPGSFLRFFGMDSTINRNLNQYEVIRDEVKILSQNTLSEQVTGVSGRVTIGGTTWNVEVAVDDTTRAKGLSNRKSLYGNTGMLFPFDKTDFHPFWMKDMLMPIDMIFFDENWKIVLIESDLQPDSFPKTFGKDIKSRYVLEVKSFQAAIYGLKVGDQAFFTNN